MGRPKKKLDSGLDLPLIDLETRRRVVKAAEQLFVTKGYRGVSMKDVAEVVEITPAALYYHFPDGKVDLFLDVIRTIFEEWAAGMKLAVEPTGNIRQRLQTLTVYFLMRPIANFPLLMRDVNVEIKDEAKKRQVWEIYGKTCVQTISDIFQEAINAGQISPQIPAPVMATMYQGMNIALLNNPRFSILCNDNVEAERLAATVASVILDGIGLRLPASQAS